MKRTISLLAFLMILCCIVVNAKTVSRTYKEGLPVNKIETSTGLNVTYIVEPKAVATVIQIEGSEQQLELIKTKVKDRTRRLILDTQQRLLDAVSELQTVRSSSQSHIQSLFKERFEMLEKTANMFIDSRLSKNKTDLLLKELEQVVLESRSTAFLSKLEASLNSVYDGIFDSLKRDIPSLNKTELTTALYCATGLSSRVLCLLLDSTTASLYNRKYRLRRHIQSAVMIPEFRRKEYLSVIFGDEGSKRLD